MGSRNTLSPVCVMALKSKLHILQDGQITQHLWLHFQNLDIARLGFQLVNGFVQALVEGDQMFYSYADRELRTQLVAFVAIFF